jgi:DNA-binding LacI/PurR family transcriptional regulator/GAF domain-containing protein
MNTDNVKILKKKMTENQKPDHKKRAKSQHVRPTIGLFCQGLLNEYDVGLWTGVADVARERGVNLILFGGGILHDLHGFNKQANVLYDLASAETVDGLVIWGAQLAQIIDLEEMQSFFERYRPLPMVSIGLALEGIPCVVVDNYQGMYDVVTHLIEAHGCHRIAFLRKAGDNQEAQERYRGYINALADHGISFDPNLAVGEDEMARMPQLQTNVIDPWSDLMYLLLDRRKLVPQVDFDAVVGHDDMTSLAALKILQARGVRVPGDVAVAGFDDIEQARCVTPPLTSVRQSFYEQGRLGAEMLLDHLQGKETSEQVAIPIKLMIRQSCGCLVLSVMQAATEPVVTANESLKVAVATQREKILSEMIQAVGVSVAGLDSGWTERLLDAFVVTLTTELDGESSGIFLATLDEMLWEVVAAGGDIMAWQNVISALRRQTLPYLGNGQADTSCRDRAEDLWRQGRVMIGETAQRVEAYQALRAEQQAQVLREIGQALITTFDVEALMDILAQELPRLGIERCYLSLYENPAKPAESSRLILAYDEKGRVELGAGGQRFPSPQLVPAGILPQDKAERADRLYSLVVEPLYFREEQLGFVLLEAGARERMVYEALRGEISSALQGTLLVKRRKQTEEATAKRVTELELVAQVSAAASTILDTTELLQQVANLVKDSFGLYHAHIYLLDEAEETLVLVAGAGKLGRQMVTEGWSIPFRREQSLVARAARTREGFIVNDVRADPNWLPNPLLPETRSELAVPLIAGERVLGVLDVQADKIDYFTDDDIRIQSTLAAQVAVALENARLFEQAQANLAFTERLYQAGRQLTAAKDLQEIVAAVAEAVPVKGINRVVLCKFEYDTAGELERMIVQANWHSGQGTPPMLIGTRYQRAMFSGIEQFVGSEPMIFGDIQHDEGFGEGLQEVWQRLNIRAMAVLPIWVGTQQTGVLLLQTEEVYQLSEEEIRPYVSLMGQVAVAVENQRLLAEANAALTEVEATQRRYTVQTWEAYRTRKVAQSYEQAKEGVAPIGSDVPAIALPATDGRARSIISNQPAAVRGQQREAQSSLVVPLTVRNEMIGILGLQETDEREWTPDEVSLVEAIGEQLARAYENLRLIDETQQRAAREARINEIGEKIRGAQSLEEALQIAIREVGLNLEAPQTAVRLEVSDS